MKTFVQFKTLIGKQTGRRAKTLRADNGREYLNNKMDEYLKQSGIRHQENGQPQRENRTMRERPTRMLSDADLKRYQPRKQIKL